MKTLVQVTSSSVFVVSGGGKGITAKCAIKLAQQHQCKFILLGRSELIENEPNFAEGCFNEAVLKKRIMEEFISTGSKPTPMNVQKLYNQIASSRKIKETLAAIKEAGSDAEYLSVDVTDFAALKAKIRQAAAKFGAVTGIIHGAGNLADKLIEKKTSEDFEKVYNAKVEGLENLLNIIPASQLQHLVLFSSVAGFYGNIVQSDYAIANEILNKSAHLVKQQNPECHVVAINWGPWDSGMVTPELKKELARRGIDMIPTDSGAQMLVNELNPVYHDSTQVVIGSPIILPPIPLGTKLRSYKVRRRLKAEANPFLIDHTISGNLVLPAACAVSWISNVCKELYPEYIFFNNSNFKVLKGITFNPAMASEHIVELQEISKVDGQEVNLQAQIVSQLPNGKLNYHFSTAIRLVRELPESPIYNNFNSEEDNIITMRGKQFYQQDPSSLFHGETFQEIQRILNISPEKITAECLWKPISSEVAGQFPIDWVNPYATDLSTHPLWIWSYHYHNQVSLPGAIDKCEQFAEIPVNQLYYVSCEVKKKTATAISADFIVHDANGKVFLRLFGIKTIILPQLLR
jgi:NAD(P)-dependent dehydrogenase (short-subunit alcohol dehydrogenase family)